MKTEKFRYLAGVIAAHDGQKVVGRTRLQKTIKLLQRVGLPTDYDYVLFFYGPYSEGLMSDLGLLEVMGFIEEKMGNTTTGTPFYTISAKPGAELPELSPYLPQIELMEKSETVVLELAATYDAFRELASNHEESLIRLHRKKGSKCTSENVQKALELLGNLNLPNN